MKITDAVKILNQPTGQHLDKIYIPSLGKEVMFHPLTTADVKTLTRMSFIDEFDLNVEGLKLGLFDKLLAEDLSDTAVKDETGKELFPAISAKTITQIDYLSFLIGIRSLLNNDLSYTFTCNQPNCFKQFEHVIKMNEEFEGLIYGFKRQNEIVEFLDEKTSNIYKFELTNFQMTDYLYYRYFMEKLTEADSTTPDIMFEDKYVKPILYIKNIWINDEIIEDWPALSIPDKLDFWNKLPPNITINDVGSNNTVYKFIHDNMFEEKLEEHINKITVTCPQCGKKYEGLYSFDNFFMF